MKLKKIELIGFKSFADKTVLHFHPGITAIVGPNGCGKSNIADAFRWVLGEQSAKSLRGGKMHDVIFSGTSKRKPQNLAEVTLTLDEIEGALPIEYEELSVSRRLFRSGESDYLVNRKPVRLKDIGDLFLDSGVGKDAFSIFEQGKLDQVINLTPLERRYIFEEAAGILRFLQRKKEALRRLEQTEQNIERVKDIHQEVERQIIILESQAEKAKIFKERKAKLEILEVALLVAKWDALHAQEQGLFREEAEKKQQVHVANTGLEERQKERQQGLERVAHAQQELQSQKEKLVQIRGEREMKLKLRETAEERLEEMAAKEAQWKRELDERIRQRGARQEEAQAALAQQRSVSEKLAECEEIRNAQLAEVRALEGETAALRQQLQTANRELVRLHQEEAKLESQFKQASFQLKHHDEHRARILQNIDRTQKTLEGLKGESASKQGSLEEITARLNGEKEKQAEIAKQIEGKSEKIKEIQKQLDAIYQEKAELKARQTVLLRLRDEMEGFSTGTKKILQEASRAESPLYKKLRGLYESLSPKEGGEVALSVVMRPYVQTLVVETRADFDAVLGFAKNHNIRDFSLLCLEHLQPEAEKLEQNVLESLLSYVQENFLSKHFLKGVAWLKDKEQAFSLIPQRKGTDIWTEEGVYVDRNGVVFFTSEGEKNIFLREAELKTLEKKLARVESRRSLAEEELTRAIQERADLQRRKNEVDEAIRKIEIKLVEEKYVLQRLEHDASKAVAEMKREQTEIDALDDKCQKLQGLIGDLKQQHADAKAKTEETQKSLNTLHETLEAQAASLAAEQKDLKDKEALYQSTAEEKRKLAHQLHVLEVRDTESRQQEKRLEEELKAVKEQQIRFAWSRTENEEKLKEIEQQLEALLEQGTGLENSLRARQQEVAVIEHAIEQQRHILKEKESEVQALVLQRAQLDAARQGVATELQERLQLSVDEARAKGFALDKSIEKSERELRQLRREIETSGDINMTSIEEFDKYKERYAFLNQQLDDLNTSRAELVEIITQLDVESRKIFKDTFEIIRQNFQKNYQILFQGGEADLLFTESADILEAGIEIVAKPPGKQMRSIQLLSGGEKCLTAIALLFAIFEVKPAPFCILDEIDAPLDDTNVERFLNVVKQFTDKCQFIIITHNKNTMAVADVIFGVSMQEKGVSKILSLEFSPDKTVEPALV